MNRSSGGCCPNDGKSYGPEADCCPVHDCLFQGRDALRPSVDREASDGVAAVRRLKPRIAPLGGQ
jgi:hypothetical protein